MFTNPLCGFSCSACKLYLRAPIITTNDCLHNLHKKCFEDLLQQDSSCPKCNAKVTKGTENLNLERLIERLDQLTKTILKIESSESPKDRLFNLFIKKGEFCLVDIFVDNNVVKLTALVRGVSPLYRACEKGKKEIAELLLNRRVDPNQKNDFDLLPPEISISWRKKYRAKHNATPMMALAKTGNIELAEILIKCGAQFDELGRNGETPVFVAICSGHEELALFFIERGVNIQVKNDYGISLLSAAVSHGLYSVVEELICLGADIREQSARGLTVLFRAAEKEDFILMEFLLANGAKDIIDVLTYGKWTPLYNAVRTGCFENVKLLVEAGADLALTYDGLDIVNYSQKKLNESTFSHDFSICLYEEREKILNYFQRKTGMVKLG